MSGCVRGIGGCSGPSMTDGPFYSAPVFDQEYLYLGSAGEQQRSLFSGSTNRSGLRTLNKMGTLQWEFKDATDRTVTSPAIAGATVYLASSDYNVYAIDTETRQARWTSRQVSSTSGPPRSSTPRATTMLRSLAIVLSATARMVSSS